MITVRRSAERGRANRGWLDARFTFSFADYYDPRFNGFRALKVLNDDRIAPGMGFGPHAHRDMEIITYMVEGHLLHRDSTGENHVLGTNEVQTMSAGTGIVHSEFNASDKEPSRSIQIWIEPASEDVTPSYQQVAFDEAEKRGRLRLLAGPDGGATTIHQDARVYASGLGLNEEIRHSPSKGRYTWIQVVRGGITVNGQQLEDGDGASVSEESELVFSGASSSGGEFLLFDLA
jgi:quercetin 2,3-dioxygenase